MKLAEKMREITQSKGKASRIRQQQRELEAILVLINKAASEGEELLKIDTLPSKETHTRLSHEGFDIKINANGFGFIISW